ncbi:Golgi SNAP receptor complex member 1 [Merluccius polli]|uniref:Golgi SNAP receptor complex member 1 n=1 Tax=Merluccius polli TaxID=89951 RepID=A0AA47MH90_MERPO|nr:Golgi SNAP receptor complex member 1 [Merluccius polli]
MPADLRKHARQLENELDLKLVSFSKLCTSYTSSRDGRRGDSSDTTPLLNNSSQDRMFDTMSVEIEQLLAKLTGVNDKMAEYTSTPGAASLNAALMHTLQRHRDILQDYTNEFHKTKGNFLAIREREDLLGSVRKDIETYKSGSGVNNRRTELFLKEHEHLRNSDRLMDDTISIAMATKENMTSQRGFLKSIQGKVNTLANRFPAINNLIQRVNLRKRRDSLILGGGDWRLHHSPPAVRFPLTDGPGQRCAVGVGVTLLRHWISRGGGGAQTLLDTPYTAEHRNRIRRAQTLGLDWCRPSTALGQQVGRWLVWCFTKKEGMETKSTIGLDFKELY